MVLLGPSPATLVVPLFPPYVVDLYLKSPGEKQVSSVPIPNPFTRLQGNFLVQVMMSLLFLGQVQILIRALSLVQVSGPSSLALKNYLLHNPELGLLIVQPWLVLDRTVVTGQ